jgi:hypothetical protein
MGWTNSHLHQFNINGVVHGDPQLLGGVWGYQEYVEAMADPKHEKRGYYMEWRGQFDAEAFSAEKATKAMR